MKPNFQPQTGDIYFGYKALIWWNPITWILNIIRIISNESVTHAGVIIENWGIPFLNEVRNGVLTSVPLSEKRKTDKWFIMSLSDDKRALFSEKTYSINANRYINMSFFDSAQYVSAINNIACNLNTKEKDILNWCKNNDYILIEFSNFKWETN